MKQLLLWMFTAAIIVSAKEKSLDDILHQSNNAATAKLFSKVIKEKKNESVVLSAFSVLTPLAQLALASVGESQFELLASIGMKDENATKAVFSKVKEQLKSAKGVTLKTASKIYVAKNFELNNDFVNLTRDIFGSEIENIDFQNNGSAQEINQWVEEQTDNHIKDLIDPISFDKNATALLVNAIYFKGLWEIPFNSKNTSNRSFQISKKKNIEVPTMHKIGNYRYLDSVELNAQVLELKYTGGESALYVLLPHEMDGIKKLKEKLKYPLLDGIIERMNETEVAVFLPKFKIETTIDLKKVLKNVNVKRLFREDEAKLDNLTKTVDSGLYISGAKQKVFIEVSEEGTEAASANDFSGRISGGGPITFDANHPFIFFLTQGNNSLFNGVYYS